MKRTITYIACVLLALGAFSANAAPKADDSRALIGAWKATAGRYSDGPGETAMFASLDFAKK